MTGQRILPPAFSDLEPFAEPWIHLSDMPSRFAARQDMAFADLQSLYAAAAPRLPEIATHLDRFDADSLPPPELHLFRLALGLVEASLCVEFFGSSRLPGTSAPLTVMAAGLAARY